MNFLAKEKYQSDCSAYSQLTRRNAMAGGVRLEDALGFKVVDYPRSTDLEVYVAKEGVKYR